MEQNDVKNWRKIVIRTDGLKWIIDSGESNTSMLEVMEIARQIIQRFGYKVD